MLHRHSSRKLRWYLAIWLCLASTTIHAQTISWHLNGWYPTTPKELAKTLNTLDAKAEKLYTAPTDDGIRALIVPHAGYTYSGAVAAAAYRLLDKTSYTTVIVIAPSHSVTFNGIALTHAAKYKVPNGMIPVQTTLVKQLAKQDPYQYYDNAFELEHAIEVQVPFLQHYLEKIKLVPLIVGNITNDELKKAATILKPLITDKTLVVVSSDFTHYGARFNYTPFTNHQALRIKQQDNQALNIIQQVDSEAFADFIQKNDSTICGHQAITLLLNLIDQQAFGKVEPRIIAYAQSNPEVTNQTESVSYAAVTFTTKQLEHLPYDQQLNTFERAELLKTAYNALNNLFQKEPSKDLFQPISTPALRTTQGAFVTLKTKSGQLRGCIGTIIGIQPLVSTITTLVADAAFRDSRFEPVTAPEIKQLTAELSILTPPHRISNINEINLGMHGIILHHNGASAVYLPEVAPEQGWDIQMTLDSLSEKAGLASQAWRDKHTWFEVFGSIKVH